MRFFLFFCDLTSIISKQWLFFGRNVSFPTLCTHAPIQKICPGGGGWGARDKCIYRGGGAARHKCDNFTPKLTNFNFRGGGVPHPS